MSSSLRKKLILVALLAYWPGLFVLTHISIPDVVRQADVSDKGLHFVSFLILTFLLWFTVSPDKKVKWRKAAPWLIALVIIAYGITDELLQGRFGRSCDPVDLAADFVSVLTGLILFSFLTFWHALLVVTALSIFIMTNIAKANLTDLLPMANMSFHLLAYAFFTLIWIQHMHLFLAPKTLRPKWFVLASGVPAGLLLIGKLFSMIIGKDIEPADIILAFVGIIAAVVAVSLACLYSRRLAGKTT